MTLPWGIIQKDLMLYPKYLTRSLSDLPASTSPTQQAPTQRTSFLKELKESYAEKKKAKDAERLVDFYEKKYGFLPKNVMTESEWKNARARAPKVESSYRFKATSYGGHSLK
jgi:hypothetical protein